jgi:flagellar hook protein FlgE
MSFALSAGVTGLQAHQKMLDVAGNNLANVNTTAFKASRIGFSELLSETVKQASQATSTIGGTNPIQMGSGVGVSSITPNMTQGNIVQTGNPLDLALEGSGYFVLSDGQQNIYSRAGAFAVDENSTLVDPATGYCVQRIGSTGEADGFQVASDSSIHIPYDSTMPANGTSQVVVSGNLSGDGVLETPQTQILESNISYTYGDGTVATTSTLLSTLDQYSGTLTTGTLTIAGYDSDGTVLANGLTMSVNSATTVGDIVDHLNSNVLTDSTASLINGKMRITDNSSGYSQSDISLSYSGDGVLETPGYFEISTIGGEEIKNVNIVVYDTQGGEHTLSAAFVRTDTENTWDMVLTSLTGDVTGISMDDRRISGISFTASDGSYGGVSGSDTEQFAVTFGHDTGQSQAIGLNFGTVGKFDGLTQFAGNSTAVAREQDGYSSGELSDVSISNEGVVIGSFSNGVKKDIAALQIALFQNAEGLASIGGGYFSPSANSGAPIATQALMGGAGSIHGGSLEKSNADVATEFVNLIQAQNGYQANARTITIANEILNELSNLIR